MSLNLSFVLNYLIANEGSFNFRAWRKLSTERAAKTIEIDIHLAYSIH